MCGILFSNKRDYTELQFKRALAEMRHRGPDSSDHYLFCPRGRMKLGHNRLKILDLNDSANQPFFSQSKKHVIIYNGEIYNFRELTRQFNLHLHTYCDTELIIELYELIGVDLLQYLNGDFAFVITSLDTGEFFVARDRLGVKPLYYIDDLQYFTCASEIAPLVTLLGHVEFDEEGLRQYKKMRTFFHGKTLYKNIKMFLPGHYRVNDKLYRYWQLPEQPQSPPTDEELRSLISTAVDYRCISDVPVGSYLSGGVDSTIVASLLNKPDTWTVGFSDMNEFEWGKLAAESCKAHHTEIVMQDAEFFELARAMIIQHKEPLSVPNEVMLYKMTRAAKAHNTVILSGEGADELFFGYDRIFHWANQFEWNVEDFEELYTYGTEKDVEIIDAVLAPYFKYKRNIDMIARFFQLDHLHGLLRRLDNSAMLASVEARVPFVDHRIIERMVGVSFDYRMQDGVVKAPLKRAFSDLLPKEIIERKKIGFPVPLNRLFQLATDNKKAGFDAWFDFNLSVIQECLM